MNQNFTDADPQETREWIESLEAVIKKEGAEKARYLLNKLADRTPAETGNPLFAPTTVYANTLSPEESEKIPSDSLIARNVAAYVRWNAMAMVVKANKNYPGIGGHIASYSSASALYEVGFNWFFKGPDSEYGGDLIYFQGHSSPGMYARAFVEGRLDQDALLHFRREAFSKGLSSYPHPWLMPYFWQFPTVSMGIGPINAIYQARFMKYMDARNLKPAGDRKVWAFLGDGETDEPESKGAISLASRENLNNLIFVINCNLQRLDGPVRGNGKIIQELEGIFKGAGWKVIKVIWGTEWDPILKKDTKGVLLEKFNTMVDGEFQRLRSRDGAFIRKEFFGKDPYLSDLVRDVSDSDLWQMSRGGHDPRKIYAAFAEANKDGDKPVVILVKTIKGYGMGSSGESANIAHNQKKLDHESLKKFRDRFHVPLSDDQLDELPFIRPKEGSVEYKFIHSQRKKLGGYLPQRNPKAEPLNIPKLSIFDSLLKGSGENVMSTTMAFVRLLNILSKNKAVKEYLVPIVPDEARTFGMEGLFRQMGIYASQGQLYEPEDSENIAWYKESASGQILEEGITEAGAVSSFVAAGTAYSNYNINMIPFYIFYSMFGFQRIGDLIWAAADSRSRGFLLGATSGRTTLNGEGLQHQDGHSHLAAATIPNCHSYDPAFAYELAVIIQHGMKCMFQEQEDIFYYVTVHNENYVQAPMPKGVEQGIIKGIYCFRNGEEAEKQVQLMGSGSIFIQVLKAAELLENDFGISCTIWSSPGITQLARGADRCETWNTYHPDKEPRQSYIAHCFSGSKAPLIAATDYMKAYPEQLRRFVTVPYYTLGTDGFGRSDTREELRDFFRVSDKHIAITALRALVEQRKIDKSVVSEAIAKYGINVERMEKRNSQWHK